MDQQIDKFFAELKQLEFKNEAHFSQGGENYFLMKMLGYLELKEETEKKEIDLKENQLQLQHKISSSSLKLKRSGLFDKDDKQIVKVRIIESKQKNEGIILEEQILKLEEKQIEQDQKGDQLDEGLEKELFYKRLTIKVNKLKMLLNLKQVDLFKNKEEIVKETKQQIKQIIDQVSLQWAKFKVISLQILLVWNHKEINNIEYDEITQKIHDCYLNNQIYGQCDIDQFQNFFYSIPKQNKWTFMFFCEMAKFQYKNHPEPETIQKLEQVYEINTNYLKVFPFFEEVIEIFLKEINHKFAFNSIVNQHLKENHKQNRRIIEQKLQFLFKNKDDNQRSKELEFCCSLIANLGFISRKRKEEDLNNWNYLLEKILPSSEIKSEHLKLFFEKIFNLLRLTPKNDEQLKEKDEETLLQLLLLGFRCNKRDEMIDFILKHEMIIGRYNLLCKLMESKEIQGFSQVDYKKQLLDQIIASVQKNDSKLSQEQVIRIWDMILKVKDKQCFQNFLENEYFQKNKEVLIQKLIKSNELTTNQFSPLTEFCKKYSWFFEEKELTKKIFFLFFKENAEQLKQDEIYKSIFWTKFKTQDILQTVLREMIDCIKKFNEKEGLLKNKVSVQITVQYLIYSSKLPSKELAENFIIEFLDTIQWKNIKYIEEGIKNLLEKVKKQSKDLYIVIFQKVLDDTTVNLNSLLNQ